MATFYVGQRVRIKLCSVMTAMTGAEALIVRQSIKADEDWDIKVDGFPGRFDHGLWAARSDELEPIQPEGHKTVEWNACLWRPEHLREVA